MVGHKGSRFCAAVHSFKLSSIADASGKCIEVEVFFELTRHACVAFRLVDSDNVHQKLAGVASDLTNDPPGDAIPCHHMSGQRRRRHSLLVAA